MNAISTVYDINKQIGKGFKNRHRGLFGVEIETETERKYEYPTMKYWECTKDGSLRDWGVEYILKAPLDGADLEKALVEFSLADKRYRFRPESVSTSVHVHINMLNESYLTVANFMTIWILLEGILVRYSGNDRMSNLFCFGVEDAEGLIAHWKDYLHSVNRNNFKKVPPPEAVKYSALNIAPMNNLGTLEARCFRGATDIEVIQTWLRLLQKMKDYAATVGRTPATILQEYERLRSGIVDVVFGALGRELKTVRNWQDHINVNHVKYAAMLASCSKDWSKFGVVKIKPVYRAMLTDTLEALSQELTNQPFEGQPFHERQMIYEAYHRRNPNARIVDVLEDV